MTRKIEAPRLHTDIAWSTADAIGVHGYDLTRDLIGKIDLGGMAFLSIMGRMPTANESTMINALLVTLVEHGMTPSAIAARMTYTGAPEALQASVAAGLLGLGSVFVGSTETAARMVGEGLAGRREGETLRQLADRLVAEFRESGAQIPGVGHPIHKPIDPRTPRLFAIAKANGFSGDHVKLLQLVASRAEKVYGRSLPINATGAIGAISCEMGLPWQACRGLAVIARSVGLTGHLLEEARRPMGKEIWRRVDDEASAHARGRLRGKRR
ncbi:MAG TPA: citryl-CoA lyase [Quisquiliibacterium sp.]|nr:citryl-CoA lyase [Quisquiliibacterium sp.]